MEINSNLHLNVKYPYYAQGTENKEIAGKIRNYLITELGVMPDKAVMYSYDNPAFYYFINEDDDVCSVSTSNVLGQIFEKHFTKINDSFKGEFDFGKTLKQLKSHLDRHTELAKTVGGTIVDKINKVSDVLFEHDCKNDKPAEKEEPVEKPAEKPETINFSDKAESSSGEIRDCGSENPDEYDAEGQSFKYAFAELNRGRLIARKSWREKGMFIFKMPDSIIEIDSIDNQYLQDYYRDRGLFRTTLEPYIVLKDENNNLNYGFNLSEKDILADDWIVINRE